MPRVSILLPVYNGEKYLEPCILSLLSQTYSDFEIIVINDGSTDTSEKIIARYAERDKRIRLVNQKNAGIVAALNKAIGLSTGEFLARMDADDISIPSRLEKQVKILFDHPSIIVCGSSIKAFGHSNKIVQTPSSSEKCKSTLLVQSCFAHPSVIIKRNKIPSSLLHYKQEYLYAEDYKLWSDISDFGDFINLSTPLLHYRTHQSQTSQKKRDAQQNIHTKIALENLLKADVDISFHDLHRALWGASAGDSHYKCIYRAISLARKISKKNQLSKYLAYRISRIALKNSLSSLYSYSSKN